MKLILSLLILTAILFVLNVYSVRSRVQGILNRRPSPQLDYPQVNSERLTLPLKSPRIVVIKSKRQLYLYDGKRLLRNYPVGLGFSPTGDKQVEGDGRTPEGAFYVCNKNEKSRYYLSLGISYPSTEDAQRGLEEGLISRNEHDKIVDAIERKERPPWNTKLGGEVMIHGEGAASDWTLGCVALNNRDIKELFDTVPKGTPIEIKN
jgi:murein L,D-transpeptidase YafK